VTNASALPARAVVQLVTTYPNGTMWRCTGTVVAKDSVLTAAHCFFNTSRGGWARSVELTPARVDAGRPQGRTWGRSLSASQLFRDREAANLGTKSEEDYGIIRTFPMQGTTTEIGDKVGTIGITTVNPTSSALNWALTLRGYPDNALPNFMYTSNDKVRTTFARGIFNHQASSLEGLSGAGAMRTANSLFGIHVGEGVGTNYGLLITSAIRATLTAWMAL
jgi:V8-like Glu-specific endopeptidase